MNRLDDIEGIYKLQGGDVVIKSIDSLPLQLKDSFEKSYLVKFPKSYEKVTKVVICGQGGSRFPSLILKNLFKDVLKVPYIINDDYILPGFVDKNTLVILSSYSGTTEEVLFSAEAALKKGAKICGITVGSKLAEFLEKHKLPHYRINPIYNPSNQPRIGFGYFVGGHMGFLFKLKFVKFNKKEFEAAIKRLDTLSKKFRVEVKTSNNVVKQLATKLYQRYPFYIVGEFLRGVGNSMANQTNETAKAISDFRVIPELNHHLMEGLKFPDILKKLLIFVFFYSRFYSMRIQKRFKITKEVVEKNKVESVWFELQGKNKVEQTLELMSVGSYLSMYLSVLYNEDPKVVPYVDYFKKRLAE